MLMFDLSTPSFKMRCEISHIVESRGGFFNESSRKPLKFTKIKNFLKVKSHSFLTMYNTLGLLSKDSELFNKRSEKITDFGENLVRRINYDHVHFFKHSFKIQIYPYAMVITGKLGLLAFC